MKSKWLTTWGLIVLGVMAFGIDAATAQTTANGPYYATPSWDQKLQCDTPATCPRFVVLANWNSDAVLDRETGLVWEKVPSTGDHSWEGASEHCFTRPRGGRLGWRLPTVQELLSLADLTQSNPALPSGHPFAVDTSSNYWSATTDIRDSTDARAVGFHSIFILSTSKSNAYYAWCVRGGQAADAQ